MVVSKDEWEGLQETLEILSHPAALAVIAAGRADVSHDRILTTEEILADLEARRAHARANRAPADSLHWYERPTGA